LVCTINLRRDELADYLASVLSGLDYAATGTYHSNSAIFWALTRVFGRYDQLVAACEEYSVATANDKAFVAELELEHFLIRLCALLDEIAYAIRVRLPKAVRGLGQPEAVADDATTMRASGTWDSSFRGPLEDRNAATRASRPI
jgi:hypothetical protein